MNLRRYEHIRLKELIELHTGYQLRETVDPNPDGKVKFIQVRDLDRDATRVNLREVQTISIEKAVDFGKYQLQEEDALFLAKGSKPGAFTVPGVQEWTSAGFFVIPMSHFLVLRSDLKRLRPSYLVWALNQRFMEPAIKATMKGSGIPFIAKPDFMEYKIPLPPLEVQEAISKLDELRKEERELVRRREALVDKLIEAVLVGKLDSNATDAREAFNFLEELRRL